MSGNDRIRTDYDSWAYIMIDTFLFIFFAIFAFFIGIAIGIDGTENSINDECANYGHIVMGNTVYACEKLNMESSRP